MADAQYTMTRPSALDELPYDEDAEQAVISALLMDDTRTLEVAELLRPDDFYAPRHQLIYKAICALHTAGTVVDPLTLSNELTGRGQLDVAGGKDYIGYLVDAVPTAANVEYHAAIVRRQSEARTLVLALEREAKALRLGTEKPEDVAARIADLTLNVQTPGKGGFVAASDAMGELSDMLLARANGGALGVPTGFSEFDYATGGIREGEFVVLAGVPGSGKTALGLQVAINNAVLRDPANAVGFVSAEMTRNALLERGVCNVGRIDNRRLRTMRLLDEEATRLAWVIEAIKKAPLHIDDTACPSVGDVVARCRALKARVPGVKLIVVDFIQLLSDDDTENRAEELRGIAYDLKGLAKELKLVIVALAQLNDKVVEARQDKRPQLSDLQGSSGMRQAADFVLLCYRPRMYDEGAPNDLVQVNIAKGRDVATFTLDLQAHLQYMRIHDQPHAGGVVAREDKW